MDPCITHHEDPPNEAPWALQVVVLLDPVPTHTAVCEATAIATMQLLTSEEITSGVSAQAV